MECGWGFGEGVLGSHMGNNPSKSVVTICYGFALRSIRWQRMPRPLIGEPLCFRRNVEQRAKNVHHEFLLTSRTSTHWSNTLLGAESSLLCFRRNVEQRAKNIHHEFLLASRKKRVDKRITAIQVRKERRSGAMSEQ